MTKNSAFKTPTFVGNVNPASRQRDSRTRLHPYSSLREFESRTRQLSCGARRVRHRPFLVRPSRGCHRCGRPAPATSTPRRPAASRSTARRDWPHNVSGSPPAIAGVTFATGPGSPVDDSTRRARRRSAPIDPAISGHAWSECLWSDMLGKEFQQPVVEAADFHDAQITAAGGGQFAHLVEEATDFLPFCADLPSEDDVPRLVPNADGQLLAVLVNADVQQDWFSWSMMVINWRSPRGIRRTRPLSQEDHPLSWNHFALSKEPRLSRSESRQSSIRPSSCDSQTQEPQCFA